MVIFLEVVNRLAYSVPDKRFLILCEVVKLIIFVFPR